MFERNKIPNFIPLVVFALLVLVSKFLWIHFFKSCISIAWDQWESEVIVLYPKWLAGTLGINDLISGHNEHRLLITRIYNLVLFNLNGNSWSIMLQVKANAVLHVITLVIFIYLLGKEFKVWQKWVLSLVGALIFCIPYGYENILCGFQSQFYFLELVSILLLASASYLVGTRALLAVLLLSLMAPFTMASGPLAILVAVAVLAVRIRIQERELSRKYTTYFILAISALIACSAIMLTPKVAGHAQFKAQSVHQFFQALIQVFSWPMPPSLLTALFLVSPLFVFTWHFLFRIKMAKPTEFFLFSLIIWLWLQLASLAYGRAVLVWSSRYKDLYALASVLGVTSILIMLNPIRGERIRWREILGWIWILILIGGYLFSVKTVMNELDVVRKFTMEQKKSLGLYLTTGKDSVLYNKLQINMPHPDPERLKWILSKPEYKSISDKACLDVSIPISGR
jgi:hypothetical protein